MLLEPDDGLAVELSGSSLLLFVTESCPGCQGLLPAVRSYQKARLSPRIVLVFDRLAHNYDLEGLPVVENQFPLFESLDIQGTPFGVVLDDKNVIVAAAPIGSVSAFNTFANNNPEQADAY